MSATALKTAEHGRATRTAPAGSRTRPCRLGLGSWPFLAATLVAINGLYILFVAFGYITDFGTNQAFVQHVLSMDTINFGAKRARTSIPT